MNGHAPTATWSLKWALFVAHYGGDVTPELIGKFMGRRAKNDIVASFSESEIGLLMRKSVEFNLPIRD
jgi:hypothetical protein